MERIVQYLDDVEDFLYAVALFAEQIRRAMRAVLAGCVALATLVLGFVLALSQPPLALAMVSLLMVTALYRATVSNTRRAARGTIAG